jgi:hypothetical protein
MRFMLMLCGDETAGAARLVGCEEWQREMAGRGALLDVMGLHPPDGAGTVRVREHEVLLTDGPFAETKEQMGGVVLIECAGREEALDIAASHPWARIGSIEVRQLVG